MRFVLNGRFLGRPVTGVERIAIQLTRAMRELLAEVAENVAETGDIAIVAPSGPGEWDDNIASLGRPTPALTRTGHLRGHAWEQAELPWVRRDAWLLSLCNVGPMLRGKQAVVICDALFVQHPESYSRLFRWWYRILLTVLGRRAAAVFTISEFSKASVEKYGLVPRGKAQVIRLGIDHMQEIEADDGILARVGARPGGYLLAIGSLARHKNLHTLIDAFTDAGLRDIDLIIAGGSSHVHQDARLRQADNIRYTGRITDGELKALYANALAFACPSLSEGFGFTPLEAMTAGCPVIATTGGAVPEVCGEAALYADPHDVDAWRDAIRRMVADAGLRAELGLRARERARLFTWRHAGMQMLTGLAREGGDGALLAALERLRNEDDRLPRGDGMA